MKWTVANATESYLLPFMAENTFWTYVSVHHPSSTFFLRDTVMLQASREVIIPSDIQWVKEASGVRA